MGMVQPWSPMRTIQHRARMRFMGSDKALHMGAYAMIEPGVTRTVTMRSSVIVKTCSGYFDVFTPPRESGTYA